MTNQLNPTARLVLEFFRDNPTAELTIADLCAIFNMEYASMFKIVTALNDRGLLDRKDNQYIKERST